MSVQSDQLSETTLALFDLADPDLISVDQLTDCEDLVAICD